MRISGENNEEALPKYTVLQGGGSRQQRRRLLAAPHYMVQRGCIC